VASTSIPRFSRGFSVKRFVESKDDDARVSLLTGDQ
jgi:hypothetical protein